MSLNKQIIITHSEHQQTPQMGQNLIFRVPHNIQNTQFSTSGSEVCNETKYDSFTKE